MTKSFPMVLFASSISRPTSPSTEPYRHLVKHAQPRCRLSGIQDRSSCSLDLPYKSAGQSSDAQYTLGEIESDSLTAQDADCRSSHVREYPAGPYFIPIACTEIDLCTLIHQAQHNLAYFKPRDHSLFSRDQLTLYRKVQRQDCFAGHITSSNSLVQRSLGDFAQLVGRAHEADYRLGRSHK